MIIARMIWKEWVIQTLIWVKSWNNEKKRRKFEKEILLDNKIIFPLHKVRSLNKWLIYVIIINIVMITIIIRRKLVIKKITNATIITLITLIIILIKRI